MKNAIVCETDRATAIFDTVRASLNAKNPSLANLLDAAWTEALPLLKKGRHKNPIHHTAHVVDLAVQIGLAQNLTDDEIAQLIVAAVFHDSGNAFEPKDEPKISVGDVRANPDEKDGAIEQRRRHMVSGGQLVSLFLSELESTVWQFTLDQAKQIVGIVEIHDNPTLAEFETGEEREKLLLHNASPLSQILREADRLWMLTEDGLVTDMMRKEKRGKSWQAQSQITHNAKRHHEERQLYEEVLGPDVAQLGFDCDTAFYRTEKGKALFRDLQRQVRDPNIDWQQQVRRAVARDLLAG